MGEGQRSTQVSVTDERNRFAVSLANLRPAANWQSIYLLSAQIVKSVRSASRLKSSNILAERVGFEPTVRLTVQRFSSALDSIPAGPNWSSLLVKSLFQSRCHGCSVTLGPLQSFLVGCQIGCQFGRGTWGIKRGNQERTTKVTRSRS